MLAVALVCRGILVLILPVAVAISTTLARKSMLVLRAAVAVLVDSALLARPKPTVRSEVVVDELLTVDANPIAVVIALDTFAPVITLKVSK